MKKWCKAIEHGFFSEVYFRLRQIFSFRNCPSGQCIEAEGNTISENLPKAIENGTDKVQPLAFQIGSDNEHTRLCYANSSIIGSTHFEVWARIFGS
jgi:hypothetical protein